MRHMHATRPTSSKVASLLVSTKMTVEEPFVSSTYVPGRCLWSPTPLKNLADHFAFCERTSLFGMSLDAFRDTAYGLAPGFGQPSPPSTIYLVPTAVLKAQSRFFLSSPSGPCHTGSSYWPAVTQRRASHPAGSRDRSFAARVLEQLPLDLWASWEVHADLRVQVASLRPAWIQRLC